jgi:hypothetical protein
VSRNLQPVKVPSCLVQAQGYHFHRLANIGLRRVVFPKPGYRNRCGIHLALLRKRQRGQRLSGNIRVARERETLRSIPQADVSAVEKTSS